MSATVVRNLNPDAHADLALLDLHLVFLADCVLAACTVVGRDLC
jgi:hypothetical protein